jgi:hypothetical protein
MVATNTNSNSIKPDKLLSSIVNIGFVILLIAVIVLVYRLFISKTNEPFTNTNTTQSATTQSATTQSARTQSATLTIYEQSLSQLYGANTRLICSMNPAGRVSNVCSVAGENYIVYNFPVHMIKLLNGSILAVFNDGRLYSKDNINNSMWLGPLDNSLPNDSIPLRMITLANDLKTLLGVGYDNKLYKKDPDDKGNLNTTATWRLIPNNTGIIYIFYDNETNNLIAIDTNGRLKIKDSSDLTSNSRELLTRIDRPILRAYYDMNGYLLVIDTRFQMYQVSELQWKNSSLNLQRGPNNSRIQDIMYDTDGTLYGLVFNPDNYMVQIMKQTQPWYLGDFMALDQLITPDGNTSEDAGNFVLSNRDIIKAKTGSISEYLRAAVEDTDGIDEDPNIAYQKQLFETRAQLKDFCKNRYSATSSAANYENWDLFAGVESNDNKINNMKSVINNLLKYEPDKQEFLDKYSIIKS